jgi:hypothetical protein
MPRACGAQIRDPESPRPDFSGSGDDGIRPVTRANNRRASGSLICARIAAASGHPSGMTKFGDLSVKEMALGGPHPTLKTMPGSGQTGIVQSRARSAASRLKPLTRQFQSGALLGKGFRGGSARRGGRVWDAEKVSVEWLAGKSCVYAFLPSRYVLGDGVVCDTRGVK